MRERQIQAPLAFYAQATQVLRPGNTLLPARYSLPITSRMMMMSTTTPNAPLGP